MNKLILIGGDLASGKTSMSKVISEKFSLPCINKDTTKEIVCDVFSYTNREENKKLSVCAFDFIEYFSKIQMSVQKDFIIECNFKKEEIERLLALVEKYNYQVFSLLLYGDIKVLHKRFIDRTMQNRHIAHLSQDFSNFDDYYKVTMGIREVQYPGTIYKIDTTDIQQIFKNEHYNTIEKFLLTK